MMKAILYEGPQAVSLKDVPVPVITDEEVLIQVEACGLCGTDLVKIFNGHLQPPVPLGHEVAGRIAQAGARVRGFKKGDRVIVAHHVPCLKCHYCLRGNPSMCRQFKRTNLDPGGFSQFVRASKDHVEHAMLKIPESLDLKTACLTEPLACALRNVRRLDLRAGDLAAVIGLGSIGLMTAQLLSRRQVTVIGFDLDPQRVRMAQKAGIDHVYTGKDGHGEDLVMKLTDFRGADALVITSGTPDIVAQRLSWVRDGGKINIFASFHPESRATIDLNSVYHRELTLLSSYSPALEDLREALRMLAAGEIKTDPYTTNAYPFERFQEAIRQVRGREILKAIILPQKS